MSGWALQSASRTFRGGSGVESLTLEVEQGSIVALVGLNGAGKTTLMRLLLGMLRPDSGEVFLDTVPVRDAASDRWRRVGHFVEAPLAYRELTVRQNLRAVARLRGVSPDAVEDVMTRFMLSGLAQRQYGRLSLGNRQRVGLAAALLHDPRFIVLDEPTNALDPAGVILLRDELTRCRARGAAVLVSSHHLDEVARIADRIVLMNRGRLIGELDPAEPDIERAFFHRIRLDDLTREVAA